MSHRIANIEKPVYYFAINGSDGTLQIKVIPVGPKLDVMFRNLGDMKGKTLEPKVIITRTNGK